MGDDQVRLDYHLVPHQENVDVQFPRPPSSSGGFPPGHCLHFLHEPQEILRREAASPPHRQVQEPRLAPPSPRFARVNSGNLIHIHFPGEQGKAFPQPPDPPPDVAPQQEDDVAAGG